MLLRREDIESIVCGKCGKDSEIVIRKGDHIKGSNKILIYPCSCQEHKCSCKENSPAPVMFIDDIEMKYIEFIGESETGHKLYTEWKSYE